MGIQSIHDQIEECRRWAAELAGTPDQKLLDKIVLEFSLLDVPQEGEPAACERVSPPDAHSKMPFLS
jgi:hypothetical protein